jgi:gliding motility-associated-like protein
MSKYLLFFALVISLTTSAQEPVFVKEQAPKNLKWDEQELFLNGFARVLLNNKFSFINKAGVLIHALEFDGARNFSNHLAAVKKEDKWGFINESGKLVIPFKYDIVFDFTETITGVFSNKRWWLIDRKAVIVKALDITTFYGFKNGIAKINKNDRWGNINTNGEIIFERTQTNDIQSNPVSNFSNQATVNNTISICPDNIDFEYGSFFNWKCYTGQVDSVGTTNVITVVPSPPTVNRHTIYNRVVPSAIDPFGLFPTNPPDGSNFALKLGNTVIGAQAERVRYTIKVPVLDSNFSIQYDYAVVFEDPGHTLWTQPRFQVNVFDSAANAYVDCASFEYISTSNLPGFTRSTVDTGVMYKPWSSVFLSLRGYAGKTMYLEFTNADCVRRGHWGYAYVDVEKPCGQAVEMQYDCTAPNITTLKGPPGFQTYNWWDQTFGTLLGTGQQIVLNPGPAINTTIWLEMIPFSNFGCLDTIPVKITGEFTADFSMSDTNAVCAPHTFTFYNRNLPSISSIWDFGDGTTGTGDTVTHTYALPGNYIVKLNVALAAGCNGSAVKLVFIAQPAGSFSFSGGSYCSSQAVRFDAITSYADSLFWDFGDGNFLQTTQTTVNHTYNTAGIFIPSLTIKSLGGCQTVIPATDTIKIDMINAGFTNNEVKICGGTTVHFTDTSYSYFGIASRTWNFGDGTTGSGTNISHTYATTGTYNVRLTINSIGGCADNETKPIYVKVNDIPIASIIGDTVACQSSSIIFNSSIQSVDSVNYYHWTSSNGFSSSANSFTLAFSQPGNYTLQLITRTVNGCADTTTHFIKINPIPDLTQPAGQILCNADFTLPINFSSSVAGTIFNWTNTSTLIGLAASGTGDIQSFQAYSNGAYVANAAIRVTAVANGCSGPQKQFSITVYPTPNVVKPGDQALCNNSNTAAITFTGTVAATTYNWINNNPSIGLAANGSGDIPSFTAINNGVNTAVASITVTPFVNNCPGVPKVFVITVYPTPDVVQPTDQILCNNSNTTAIAFSGAVTGTTYNWTNNNPSIGLAASGTGNILSFNAKNNGANIAIASITVTASVNGCPGASKIFNITVNPTSDVLQPANQTVCNADTINSILFSGSVSGATYNWTNNNPLIGLASWGTGDISSYIAINKTSMPITANITVTPASTSCPAPSKTFSLIINPTPAVIASNNASICLGGTAQLSATGAAQYTWLPVDYLSCANCANPVSKPVDSIIYKVKGTSLFGCVAFDSVLLSVVKPFKMQVLPGDTLCLGESLNLSASKANSYLWSPAGGLNRTNIANPIARPSVTTTYKVIGFDGNNCFTDSAYVSIIVGPKPTVNLGSNRTLATGTALTLNAVTQGGPIISWLWTPPTDLSCNNCPSPTTIVKNNSFYSVLVTNDFGCTATDTIFINSICKSAQVFIPNAFTPDGDGLNDVLMVRGKGVTIKSFRIFNRWGELVFEKENFYPNDLKYGWDGKVRGVPATPDVFVYTAEVFCDNGVVYTYKGNTTILK